MSCLMLPPAPDGLLKTDRTGTDGWSINLSTRGSELKTRSLGLFVVGAMLAGTLAYSSAAKAFSPAPPPPESTVICNDESVASLGGFNDEATCPSGSSAMGGGYELVTTDFSNLLAASVNENNFVFSNTTPTGWEVVGTNNTSIAGKIRVCVSCAQPDQPSHR